MGVEGTNVSLRNEAAQVSGVSEQTPMSVCVPYSGPALETELLRNRETAVSDSLGADKQQYRTVVAD